MSEWRPITDFDAECDEMVLLTDGVTVAPGWFCNHKHFPWPFIDSTKIVGAIIEGDEEEVIIPNAWPYKNGPTHWMPLPRPPK